MLAAAYHYFPLAPWFQLALLILFGMAVALIEIGVLQFAYSKLGLNRWYVYLILLGSLLGSYVNVPVAELPGRRVETDKVISYYGVQYVIPRVENWPGTIIAVNIGGAVIPTLLSLWLLVKHRLYLPALLATSVVAVAVHWMAQPVHGVGIVVPTFVPPIVAAATAMAFSWGRAAPLAYIAGSVGTLIGADLMNLSHISGLGAPVASIGGAGTFDGVFVTGILAVLLAWGPVEPPPKEIAETTETAG